MGGSDITTRLTNLLMGCGCLIPMLAIGFFIHAIFNRMGFIGFIFLVISIFVSLMIIGQAKTVEDKEIAKQRERLATFKMNDLDFDKLPTIISSDILTRIAVDNEKRRIYLWLGVDENGNPLKKPKSGMQYRFFNYAYKDLKAIATIIDGNIRSSSPSYVNPALANFIKQEPAAGTTVTNAIPADKVRSMALIIQIDNENYPFYPIRLYHDMYKYLSKASSEYISAFEKMQHWFEKLDSIMDKPVLKPLAHKQHPQLQTSASVTAIKETIKPAIEPQAQEAIDMARSTTNKEVAQREEVAEVTEFESETIEKVDIEQPTYSYNVEPVVENEYTKDTSITDNVSGEKKELSYFEQLVEKNKRQLTDSPSKEKKE